MKSSGGAVNDRVFNHEDIRQRTYQGEAGTEDERHADQQHCAEGGDSLGNHGGKGSRQQHAGHNANFAAFQRRHSAPNQIVITALQ